MSEGPASNSPKDNRLLWSVLRRCARAAGWGLRKGAVAAAKATTRLQDRYLAGEDRREDAAAPSASGSNHPAEAGNENSPEKKSFPQQGIDLLQSWGRVIAGFAMSWGRWLMDYAVAVARYYWQNGNSIKEYLIDFDPNFRPPSVTRREIILDADRSQVGGVWDGESWDVELPKCCVVCGKQSRIERNSEIRIVEHFRRPVWIVAACWAVGFIWAIWNFRFSYLLIGVAAGLALGHRFREFLTVRVRYQRCRDHVHQTEFPGLRAFGRLLIVTTGHKSVRQQFVDLTEGNDLGGVAHEMGPVSPDEDSPPPPPIDSTPIALVDHVEGESTIQHQEKGLESPSRPDSLPNPASDVYISVPDAPTRSTPVSPYYRKTLGTPIEKEQSISSDSRELPSVPPADVTHTPLLDESPATFLRHTEESYRPSSASDESYALRGHAEASGSKVDQLALQRSDYQRALLWQEGLAADVPPGLKQKPTLKTVLQGCFDAEHVLAEAFVSMLVFLGWGFIGGLIYAAYLYRDLVLSGNEQVLAVYAVINVTLSVLFALSLGWGTIYLLTVGAACVVIAFQEQILPVVARNWIQSHLTLSTLKVELIVLSTVPLLAMMGFAFLRSLSAQCGNLMWISRRAAWEEQAVQGINRPLGDLNRAMTIVIWALMPAILTAGGIAYGYYQFGWTREDVQAHQAFVPAVTALAAFALIYVPVGFSVAGVKGSTNPVRVAWWVLRSPVDYLACYAVALPYLLLGAVIVGCVYFALIRQNVHFGRFENLELVWWAAIAVAVGVIQYPLIALSHMFGLVALKNEPRLHWKGKPAHG